ncbi:hypothetical protein GCM10010256_10280 [Streptomyces coeruleorubidus]|nr:hypothetical protein GCM10010256_10280 [Streptomyces coeruleorubidus]
MRAGAELGGVPVEGPVADVVKCLDGPVAADQGGELGGGGAVGGQAGDRVDLLDRDLAGSAVHAAVFDLDRLADV